MHRRWLAVCFLGLTGAAIIALSLAVWPVLIPLAIATALAYALAPLVAAMESRGLGRGTAILVVYAGLGLVMALVALRVVPAASRELGRFASVLPRYVADVGSQLAALQDGFVRAGLPKPFQDGLQNGMDRLQTRVDTGVAGAVSHIEDLWEWALYLAISPVLAYYLLRDLPRLKLLVARSLPQRWRHPAGMLLKDLDNVLGGFVRGQLLVSVAVAALVILATYLLGLRHSLLLGLWAGLTELIPYVGPFIGAVPAVALGFAISPVTGVQVLLAFALIQQIENSVMVPKLMGESVGLHPLAVVLAVLAGGFAAGIWGAVLAVPMAGVVRAVWGFAYRLLVQPAWAEGETSPSRGGAGRRGPGY